MINVTAIKLPESFDSYKKTEVEKADKNTEVEKAEFLEPISKINIFVGANNSGKSRFMRHLSMQNALEVKINEINLEEVNAEILNFIKKIQDRLSKNNITNQIDYLSVKELANLENSISNSINSQKDKYQDIRAYVKQWEEYERVDLIQRWQRHIGTTQASQLVEIVKLGAQRVLEFLDNVPIYSESDNPKKVYIPTLRGLRRIKSNVSDIYKQKTIEDYFHNQISKDGKAINPNEYVCPEIFTGLSLYDEIKDLHNGKYVEQKKLRDYENFISKELFEKRKIILTPNNSEEQTLYVKIGNENEQPIHKLGDGIQSAIILSFLPFVMQEQTFFFIEEPEMFLHPGLQRKLLNFYSSLKQHTFFLTTHSNHFLDITIDIKDVSIFTFRKILDETKGDELNPDFTIEAVDSGCESSLELLGVRNSSVFLVNATIWVEGITDRWYFRKMLESYIEYLEANKELTMRLEEDTHYSFVEYGGANITHWSFLDKEERPIEVKTLCAKAIVIIDEDGNKKTERKEKLEEFLGERLIILPCREVENLLPYDVIKEVVLEYENTPDLTVKDFEYEQYKDLSLGRFIEDKMLKKNPQRRGGYKADSGTIKSKVDFCEKALPKITFADLPESTKEIVKKIYDFICKQNSH